MIRWHTAVVALLAATLAVPAAARDLAGAWTATSDEQQPDRLDVSMRVPRNGQNGMTFDRSAFTGLSAAQVGSERQVPVQFELRREAGTIRFEGTFRAGQGAGEFTFLPNPEFPGALRALGIDFQAKRGDENHELFSLAVFDVSTEFVRSMQAIGYSEPLETYQQFRIFDVNPAYVRDMASVGFKHLSADKLVETRIHGATPEYIRTMRAAGNDLSLDDYIQSRIFQVTPEFAADMGRAGYANLDHDTLVQFRIHGVTREFIDALHALGYAHVPADKLVEMRIHGVTPEFIRRVNAAGYRNVPIDKLVQMRIFDIDPKMVRALDDAAR